MKKTIQFAGVLVALMLIASVLAPVMAAAEEFSWHLSGDVMPIPPYGSRDIPGSDTASKLIVNHPNGKVMVTITGVMNGLHPNTEYTVYLSNGYAPYVFTGWSVVGSWVLRFNLGRNYDHDVVIDVQSDGTFSGTGGYPAGGEPYSFPYNEIITGTIDAFSGEVTIHCVYQNGYWYEAVGTIAPDGTMSGTWGNTGQGYGHSWLSISGNAVKTHTGDTYWPGLLTSTVLPFTFNTDDEGSGSWHINLRATDIPAGATMASVWINEAGATVLISDSFSI